jgi:hypothetical protein
MIFTIVHKVFFTIPIIRNYKILVDFKKKIFYKEKNKIKGFRSKKKNILRQLEQYFIKKNKVKKKIF